MYQYFPVSFCPRDDATLLTETDGQGVDNGMAVVCPKKGMQCRLIFI